MARFFPLAPAFWLVGWCLMRIGGSNGPNVGWIAAHSVWIVAFALFGVAAFGLYRFVAEHRAAGLTALALSLVGTVAMIAHMGVDIAAAVGTDTRAELAAESARLTSAPGVELLLFDVGPALLFAGLLGLLARAAAAGALSWTTWTLVAVGIVLMVVGRPLDGWLRALEGFGVLAVIIGMDQVASSSRMNRADRSHTSV
ncbi:hypothetical protein [Virgisporangium aliadipatigenens]|nr:hypothetical protein [Virgisporangium aliadipatigenens]